MKILQSDIHHRTSFIIYLVFAVLVWGMFFPGVFTADSYFMIFEASTDRFADMHALLLPSVLAMTLRAGLNISWLILLQSLAGFMGLRQVILELQIFLHPKTNGNGDLLTIAMLGVFVSPFTPFSVYMVTLWTDTWLAILLLWILAIFLNLHRHVTSKVKTGPPYKVCLLVLLTCLAMLVRYNAVVLYPILGIIIVYLLRKSLWNWPKTLATALAPAILSAVLFSVLNSAHKPMQSHPEYPVFALDLASMIIYDPSVCRDLSIGSCNLVLGVFPDEYIVGNGAIDFAFNQGQNQMPVFFNTLAMYPKLSDEYWEVVRAHPLTYVQVKILNIFDYLRPDSSRYIIPDRATVFTYGMYMPAEFPTVKRIWMDLSNDVIRNVLLRWFSYVHLTWVLFDVLGLLVCYLLWRRARDNEKVKFMLLLLSIPAAYDAGYLIAFTTSEFRFMYPSMLLVQIITLTAGFAWLFRRTSPFGG